MATKKILGALAGAVLIAGMTAGSAQAVPSLQLNIGGGYYVGGAEETIFSSGSVFDLYAYLDPAGMNTLTDTYMIAAALTPPVVPPGADLGTFSFNGTDVAVTSGMVFGVPPLEANLSRDPGDLQLHSIYLTYFREFPFQFNPAVSTTRFDAQTNPGTVPVDNDGGMYFARFSVDTTGLAPGYQIHFDLYNTNLPYIIGSNADIDIVKRGFAPFSHDAQSNGHSVPEPGTFLLLGTGLLGLGLLRRRRS